MSLREDKKQGYMNTQIGWVPETWKIARVQDVGEVKSGRQRSPKFIEGVPRQYLRVANIFEGYIDTSDLYTMNFTDEEFNRYRLIDGDILLNEGQSLELVGRCAIYRGKPENCCYQNTLIRFRPNGSITSEFALSMFTYMQKSKAFSNIASRTTSIAHLGASRFSSLRIAYPPLNEQKKISAILSTWDNAIEQTRNLIEAKKCRKKAMMQQLLSGRKRLSGVMEAWEEFHLGELFKERVDVNCGHLPLLAITGNRGVIPASEIERKDSSSEDKSRYKRIASGDIGYNTMRMWQGVSAVSALEGIVSPAYTICVPKDMVDVRFMGYLFKVDTVINLFRRYSQGLVADTLNLKFHHFAQIKVRIPNRNEQERIAGFLSDIDDEIEILLKQLAALEKQKRGLMQKLLTGEVRVTV